MDPRQSAGSTSPSTFGNAVLVNETLNMLSLDETMPIPIVMKAMFEKTLSVLEVETPPDVKAVQCGDGRFMFTIKVDTTNLPSITDRRVWFAFVEGPAMANRAEAEASAIENTLKYLQSNHLIKIVDFSRMLVDRVLANDTHGLLSKGVDAFDIVLVKWDVAVSKSVEFEAKLEKMQGEHIVYAPRTASGWVFASLCEYLSEHRCSFYHRTVDAKTGLTEARNRLAHYQSLLEEKDKTPAGQPGRDAILGATFMLEHVMSFFGLARPQYVSTPRGYGFVESTVTIAFPSMDTFQVSGKIQLVAKSSSTAEANEEAAYKALKFIEENFNTKIVDFNYSLRKNFLKEEGIISEKLSDVLEQADSVKMMFGELITSVEGKRHQYSFDPHLIFDGDLSAAQIDAYHYCSRGLAALAEELSKCYASCAQEFEVLNKLEWKYIVMKSKSPE